jgi:gliding motility-associated-like protein
MKFHAIALLFCCILSSSLALGQGAIPTKGKEFWVGFLQNWESIPSENEQLNLFITSDQNTTGTVEVPGQGWSQNFTITANQTTTVTIPNGIAEHFTSEVVESKGVYIETQDTVAVFAINFQAYTADGTKVLPIQSLGTEYRVVSYRSVQSSVSNGTELLVVATEDGTEVEIIPTVNTLGGNPAGVPFTVQLDRGESYQVKSADESLDITGTVVRGTEASGDCRPFAVFSGTVCARVPYACTACDHIFEQNFPSNTWGTEYVVVPFNFTSQHTFRILANEDNTAVTVNNGAPFILNAGQFQEYNSVTNVRCVSADKGVCVVQYMEGVSCASSGDPAMMILNSADQKISDITFSTVTSNVITNHSLTVIVSSTDVGTVSLDGAIIPVANFTTIGSCTEFAFAHVTLTPGSHTLQAPNGFTAYVYGTGSAESYAYSVGSFTPAPPIVVEEAFCTNNAVTMAVEGGLTNVYWYAQSNPDEILGFGNPFILEPPYATDIYVGVGDQFLSGCVIESLFSVENPDPIVVSVTQSATEICQFQSVQLNAISNPASGAYTYTWTPAAGLDNPNIANPIATPMSTTTYSVLVSTLTGCSNGVGVAEPIEVSGGNVTGFDIVASAPGICFGESLDLDLDIEAVVFEDDFDPGISWGLWSNITNGNQSAACGSVNGNALYFNGIGGRSATTNAINLINGGTIFFALKIGADVAPCDNADPGEDVVLEYATAGSLGPWTLLQTFNEAAYPDFTNISVNVPPAAQTAATHFRWRQLANSGNNQDNWALDNIQIGALNTEAIAFAWSPSNVLDDPTSQNPTATPIEDTMFYATFTDLQTGCAYSDSVFVTVTPEINLALTPDTVVCGPSGIALEAIPDFVDNYTYSWTGANLSNSAIANPIANPTVTTTYSVTVTSTNGCTVGGEVEVVVSDLNNLQASASETLICVGQEVALEAIIDSDSPVSIEWSPSTDLVDANSAFTTATPVASVTYSITVTDLITGCVLSDAFDIEVSQAFTIDAGEDLDLCVTQGHVLNVTTDSNEPLTWSWTNAQVLSSGAVQTPTIAVPGTYTFTVSAATLAGCTASDDVVITQIFEGFGLGPDVTVCEGESVVIDAGFDDGSIHAWSTGETTPSIDVTQNGTYSVEITSTEGCVVNDVINVDFLPIPTPNLGDDPGLCVGEVFTLTPGAVGASYAWSTGSTAPQINVVNSGVYSVIVTNAAGCSESAEIELVFQPLPTTNLPSTVTVCEDEVVTLDPAGDGTTFAWSTGQQTPTIQVSTSGTYSVVITSGFGCVSTDETEVTMVAYPIVNLGPDAALCLGESFAISSGQPDLNHLWSTGEVESEITVSQSGIYTVTVDNDYCFISDEVTVVFNLLPANPMFPDTSYCFEMPPYEAVLNALNPGSTFLWEDGSTNQLRTISSEGLYSVTVTTPFGCALTFDYYAVELCPGYTLYIPNAFTPDQDGINDVFRVVGLSIEEFEMSIWNRWGEKIWETTNINEPWDGSYKNREHYVEAENYVYVVRFTYRDEVTDIVSEWQELTGFVTLIR